MRTSLWAASCALAIALAPQVAAAQATLSGTWSMAPSKHSDEVRFELRVDSAGNHDESSFDISPQQLGISDEQLRSAGTHITFTFAREAGSFACEGGMAKGSGGGTFLFSPSTAYLSMMRAHGYTLDPHQQMTAATLDLTTAYVNGIAAAGFAHLSFEKLVSFRALRIDEAYIRSMRAAFGGPIDAEKMLSLRALGIDAAYIKRVQAHGFANLTIDQVISLKALNVI